MTKQLSRDLDRISECPDWKMSTVSCSNCGCIYYTPFSVIYRRKYPKSKAMICPMCHSNKLVEANN